MMMKRKADRYSSWDEAIEDIEDALAELNGETPPEMEPEEPSAPADMPAPSRPLPAPPAPLRASSPGLSPAQMRWLRIAALLMVLLASLFAFQRILRRSLHEDEVRRLAGRYRQVAADLLEFQREPGRERFNQTYIGLTQVKKEADRLGETLLAQQTDLDLQTLKDRALVVIRERRDQLCREELERLKSRSEILEIEGRYDEAIRLWQEYQGDFRDDLRDEIRRHIAYLEQKRQQREAGLE
jgi:hypothetical protein